MRRPSARLSRYCSWLPLQPRCVAQTWPRRLAKPAVPAATSSEESWPVRPCRPVRTQVPCWTACRCGWFSRHQRPVRSSSSVASRGTGSTEASSSSWYSAVPLLVSVCASSRRPPGCRVSSELTSSPASASRWMISTPRPPSCTWADNHSQGRREVLAGAAVGVPVPAQARPPGPAGGGLREQPGGDGDVEGGVRDRPAEDRQIGEVLPEVGAPMDDLGLAGVEGQQEAGAGRTQVHGVHGDSLSVVRKSGAGARDPGSGTPRTGRRRCRRHVASEAYLLKRALT